MRYLRFVLLGLLTLAALVMGGDRSAYAWEPPDYLNWWAIFSVFDDRYPQVTTDGAGNWLAVWESEAPLGIPGDIGTDYDILVARSTDNGASWEWLTAVNTNAATDSGWDGNAQVATDGAGNWVAVWQSDENLGGIGTDEDILVARSTDNGATWTAPATLNSDAYIDDTISGYDRAPQVTTDGSGNWLAVWVSPDYGIWFDADILMARSTDNGATWTARAAVNTDAVDDWGYDERPQVTTDGAGNWVAVWMSNYDLGGTVGTDYDFLVARSTDNGASWTAPAALNSDAYTDSGDDGIGQVTTDGAGNWVAVWMSQEDPGGIINIHVARSTDNGATWTAQAALNTDTGSGDDWYPQVTTDGAGKWVAVWESDEANVGGGIGTDFDILVASSTDNGSSWSMSAALNTNAATDSGLDGNAQVTTDGADNWMAVWHSDDDLGGTIGPDFDILYSFSLSPDADGDGVLNEHDNCPLVPNPGQENDVHPGTPEGDHCEDPEPDGVFDIDDNCPDTANPGQENDIHPGTPEGDHCEDPEPDGVFDISDNCPDTSNPSQENDVHPGTPEGDHCEDPDVDLVYDISDNCPDTPNPSQENNDGDAMGDVCDPNDDNDDWLDVDDNCPFVATPWPVPPGDGDCDGFTDADEGVIGTDPADNCANTSDPNDEVDDRWPSDFDDNQVINLGDLFNVLPPHFGSSPSIPDTNGDGIIDWSPRRDLAPDGFINLGDVFMVLPPYFAYMCT